MKKLLAVFVFVLISNSIALSQETYMSDDFGASPSSGKIYKNELTERFFSSGIILLEVAILVMVLYYWKKTRSEVRKEEESTYKRNIKAIRDERVFPIFDKDISKKRKILNNLIAINELNGRNISNKARTYDISKGELYLAAKIHSLTQQVR